VSGREGLLKTEYSDWYPNMVADFWCRAGWLVDTVLQQLRSGESRWQPEDRVACDQHFVSTGAPEDMDPPPRAGWGKVKNRAYTQMERRWELFQDRR
jgi:hypothetical protein